MRASLLFIILIAWQLGIPGLAAVAGAFLVMQIIGVIQVMRFGYKQLR
jgi:CDP-diacylglycerol--glycerol-3-phosphate 3-phosphatidyltransferase